MLLFLLSDLIYPGGYQPPPPPMLFGNNVTEIANNEILPMCPIVNQDYRKHSIWSNG